MTVDDAITNFHRKGISGDFVVSYSTPSKRWSIYGSINGADLFRGLFRDRRRALLTTIRRMIDELENAYVLISSIEDL